MSGRSDRLSPAAYTVGEVRDLAEEVFVRIADGRGWTVEGAARFAIVAAETFAQTWGGHTKVKP